MSVLDLSARALSRRFGKTQALSDVDLDLERADFVALLGPAGAGKTTLLRILAGLEVPDRGSVTIRGADMTATPPKDRDVAMIFDSLALYPDKTGFENIATPLRIRKLGREAIRAQVDEVAGVLGIRHILERFPRTMSGGERQRVALGRALVRNPTLFLLDEPLSSLDAQLRVALRAELRRLQRERQATFLYATPDHAEAMAVSDRIAILIDGQIRQQGTPQEIYETPIDRDVARFVGSPEINIIPAEFADDEVYLAGIPADATKVSTLVRGSDRPHQAGLRPEHVLLDPRLSRPANGRVIDTEPLGLRAAVTVATDGGVLRATLPQQDALGLENGTPVTVQVSVDRILWFDAETGARRK